MRPVPTRIAPLLATIALLLGLGLPACAPPPPEPFRALGLTAGSGPVFLDEALTLRFSRPLGHVPAGSIVVKDAIGRPIPIEVTRREDRSAHLDLSVRHPKGLWPAASQLSVSVIHPTLGAPLTAADGAELTEPFNAVITTSARSATDDLLLVEHPFERQASGEFLLRSFESGASSFILEFDGGLDGQSLATGVQIVEIARPNAGFKMDITCRLDPTDWRRVEVPLFRDGLQLFDAAREYRLVLTTALQTLGGRRPRQVRSLSFRTPNVEGGRRTLRIPFRDPTDLSREFNHGSAWLEHNRLRPRAIFHAILPAGTPTEALARQTPNVPPFFGPEPARIQLLVSAEAFPPKGANLLTGLSLATEYPLREGDIIQGLSLSIGYLSEGSARAGTGLSEGFRSNRVQDYPLPSSVPLSQGASDLVIGRDLPVKAPSGGPAYLTLPFERPWLKTFGQRDLVLEITHNGIRKSPTGALTNQPEAVSLMGLRPATTQGGVRFSCIGPRRARRGVALPIQVGVALELKRIEPVVSRWYVVDDLHTPVWSLEGETLVPSNDEYSADDITLSFQEGTPRRGPDGKILWKDGRPLCDPVYPEWSNELPRPGTRAVRIRIDFSPAMLVRVERGERPEIEYVLLRYREGREPQRHPSVPK